jgi:hypothetical protein
VWGQEKPLPCSLGKGLFLLEPSTHPNLFPCTVPWDSYSSVRKLSKGGAEAQGTEGEVSKKTGDEVAVGAVL